MSVKKIIQWLKFWEKDEEEKKLDVDEDIKMWYENAGLEIPTDENPTNTKKEKDLTPAQYREKLRILTEASRVRSKTTMLKQIIAFVYLVGHFILVVGSFINGDYILPIGFFIPPSYMEKLTKGRAPGIQRRGSCS